jgi:hypothetical protein
MRAWDLITLLDAGVQPEKTKIHLAVHNDIEDPLHAYRAGRFPEWQSWQRKRNFERAFVVALIQMSTPYKWLFAGCYDRRGSHPDGDGFMYELEYRPLCQEMDGRLVANFERSGRQSYLNADAWVDQITISEILRERMSVQQFPGFKGIRISKAELDLIVQQDRGEWQGALSNVAGVYLIADTQSGLLYVGSATGQGGIWQRWRDYSISGHGGNIKLKALLESEGISRSAAFQFSVLEIADTHSSSDEVLKREYHWMDVLLSRNHGLNSKGGRSPTDSPVVLPLEGP